MRAGCARAACSTTSARRKSAKAIWARRLRHATPGPNGCGKYACVTESNRAKSAAEELLEYSEELMRAFLLRVPPGTYRAEDFLDNDGISDKPVKIAVTLTMRVSRGHGAQGTRVTRSRSISPGAICRSKAA